MNDSPLPGCKRAVLISIAILIILSFCALSLDDWEDEDYLSGDEGLCFGVKNVPSNVLKIFFRKRVKFNNSMLSFTMTKLRETSGQFVSDSAESKNQLRDFVPARTVCNLRC